MPLPKPNKGDDIKKYTSRFMGNKTMVNDYPDIKQRYAIAISEYARLKRKRGK